MRLLSKRVESIRQVCRYEKTVRVDTKALQSVIMIFACGIVFVLGIRNSIVLNSVFLIMVIVCFRLNVDMSAKFIYGDNITLRFPYLFICFALISYCLMYIIQRYWVEKRKRNQILEERVHDEKKKLESMSMKVIDTMSKALSAKIPGEEEHCNNVAEYSRSIAQRMNLNKKSCDDAYKAGLLHEIGMIGIPDALINKAALTDDEYEIFKTYVSKGYQIINMLQTEESLWLKYSAKAGMSDKSGGNSYANHDCTCIHQPYK